MTALETETATAAISHGRPTPPPTFRLLGQLDAWVNGLFGQRWNPFYHSGTIALAMLAVLMITGVYLLIFYRIGAPYASVARIDEQAVAGRWIRALHRFASDAALVAALAHAFRMYAQRRTWGPRVLAWLSGVALVLVVLVSGWTGYVLVWDVHAQVLAAEGARLMDALPLFAEPISRSFVGEGRLPSAFFFLNLFAHIALPIGLAVLVWVHVARVARPALVPERGVLIGTLGAFILLAVLWPVPLAPEADLLRLPGAVPMDWFFAFWLPVTRMLPAWSVWLGGLVLFGVVCAVPWLTQPRPREIAAIAEVNPRTCVGCEQCALDCPYDAIEMVPRTDGRDTLLAVVNPDLCTSCGICIGSCPTMAIGPAGDTARVQLAEVRAFLERHRPGAKDVVVVGCMWSAARSEAARYGAGFMPIDCVGSLHTSTVELLLRGGAGGVIVAGCPSSDARTREGLVWTDERLFGGRPADLKVRVDRRRVKLVQAAVGERAQLHEAVQAFRAELADLPAVKPPQSGDAGERP